MRFRFTLLTLIFGLLASLQANAEQSVSFGDYTVHYNAFRSDSIPAEVAHRHGIVRSSHRAVINITVMKKQSDGSTIPVSAQVWGSTTNLNNQLSALHFFPVHEKDTVYYLDQFRIDNNETLKFKIHVDPSQFRTGVSNVGHERSDTVETIEFSQNFYTG